MPYSNDCNASFDSVLNYLKDVIEVECHITIFFKYFFPSFFSLLFIITLLTGKFHLQASFERSTKPIILLFFSIELTVYLFLFFSLYRYIWKLGFETTRILECLKSRFPKKI